MPNFYLRHKYKIDQVLLIIALIVFIYVFFTYLFSFFAPFVIGFIFSLILEPPVRLLTKRFKLKRGVAAAICLFTLIIALIFLSGTIVNKIIIEANSFVHAIPLYVNELTSFINEIATDMESFANGISEQLWSAVESANLFGMMTSWLGIGVRNSSWNFVTNIPGVFLNLLLSFISAFFFIRDRDKIFNAVTSLIPDWLSSHFLNIKKGLIHAVWGYLKAQAIIISIVTCILIVGLIIVGYPYALFVGLLIAFVDMLPIFGSGAVLWPWAVYCFINNDVVAGVKLIIIYLIVITTRQSLEPRIVGGQIGVHPLLTLMSMFVGLRLFGVIGLIIGPALVVSAKVIYESQRAAERD